MSFRLAGVGQIFRKTKNELGRIKMTSKKVTVQRKTQTRMKKSRKIRMMMTVMTRVMLS